MSGRSCTLKMLLDDVPYRAPVILLNLCFASIPFGRPNIFRHTMLLRHGTLTWWFGCKTGEGEVQLRIIWAARHVPDNTWRSVSPRSPPSSATVTTPVPSRAFLQNAEQPNDVELDAHVSYRDPHHARLRSLITRAQLRATSRGRRVYQPEEGKQVSIGYAERL